MTTVREPIRESIAERATRKVTGILRDENGDAIPGSALVEVTLTLYALDDERTIINDRDHISILNENGGTVGEDGAFAYLLTPEDNAIVGDVALDEVEEHILLIEFLYDTDKIGRKEILVRVVNMGHVPIEPTP